jgi:hypothetical protein
LSKTENPFPFICFGHVSLNLTKLEFFKEEETIIALVIVDHLGHEVL